MLSSGGFGGAYRVIADIDIAQAFGLTHWKLAACKNVKGLPVCFILSVFRPDCGRNFPSQKEQIKCAEHFHYGISLREEIKDLRQADTYEKYHCGESQANSKNMGNSS